jgi:sporulation protein YlmC with PRC-barrel domain
MLNGEEMVKFIIAKQLVGKKVVSVGGYDIGRMIDAEISGVTGKINFMLIEPSPDSALAKRLGGESGTLKIPYSAVTSVADYIMVDTKTM